MEKSKSAAWLSCAIAVVLAAVASPSASASSPPPAKHLYEAYVTMRGARAPGPAADDAVHVLKVGSESAHQILVLVPGQFGAAGSLRQLAEQLAGRLPDTQIWAVDRREQDLADLSGFRKPPDQAAAYYLGGNYRTQNPASDGFVAGWGLTTELNDLRQVVLAARDGGRRRVVLGGHSWGATTAMMYAGWDFDGRAGYRDLSGLILIDGGVHDAFAGEGDVYRITPGQATNWLATIRAGEVFDPEMTVDRTETLAILEQLAGEYALDAPTAPSPLAGLLPEPLRPTEPVTNEGLVRWLWVQHPLVPDLSINPAYSSLTSLTAELAGPQPGMIEWYWPERLTLDLEAADPFADTPVTRQLGLRLWHTTQIDIPLLSFQTGLTHGTANQAAQWVVAHSRIPYATYAEDPAMTHIDPLLAPAGDNAFIKAAVPFLERESAWSGDAEDGVANRT